MNSTDRLYYRIGDVAELVGVKPYVLRFWETEFPSVAPQKSEAGQRVYRKKDVEAFQLIKHLLYAERYSIEGARKRIKELKKKGELKSFQDAQAQNIQKNERNSRILGLVSELRSLIRSSAPQLEN